jgi:LysM repeat protein
MRWPSLLAPALALVFFVSGAWAEPSAVRYTVRRGDTLSGIAKRFGVSVESIRRWNAMKKDALWPGRKIGVPLPPGARARPALAEAPVQGAKSWHDLVRAPARPGFVSIESVRFKWQGHLLGVSGQLVPEGERRISELLANGADQPIDARLIALVGRVSDTFGGRRIHVISGYRPGRRSRHAHGQAIDLRIEGVPNWALHLAGPHLRHLERGTLLPGGVLAG